MELADVDAVIERFVAETIERIRPVALWAHGSLAGGDFQPGRSDLDLIAVVREPLTPGQVAELTAYHQRLHREEPAAAKLHCSYLAVSEAGDAAASHFTWAVGRGLLRPVSLVTRRELLSFGRVLAGAAPGDVLPPVSDEELAAYIRYSLRKHVLEVIAWPHVYTWFRDAYVDLCTLIVARGAVTLRDGRLTTKGEALDELARRGAPARLVADIRARRYGDAHPTGPLWRVRRALMFRNHVRAEARGLLESATSGEVDD